MCEQGLTKQYEQGLTKHNVNNGMNNNNIITTITKTNNIINNNPTRLKSPDHINVNDTSSGHVI